MRMSPWIPTLSFSLLRKPVRLLGATGWLALAACAPLSPPGVAEFSAGRTRLALPPGAWEDWGRSDQGIPLPPELGESMPLQTRAVVLRGARQELLAVLLVQTNRTNAPRDATLWSGACGPQRGVWVEDAAAASPVRIDCLRFKRWANQEDWLGKNHPRLAHWLSEQKVAMPQPYSHLHYRYATAGGAWIELNALVDQRLLQPRTHSNEEFLRAGQPAQDWARQMAQAVRTSTSMMDGHLPVPPFPLPLPTDTVAPPSSAPVPGKG
ncbi:MAG: hypothetical protein PHI55_00275 [Burkholderiaceae bacterium]|nr:hypothetical protein [Burkholderiaceae bacterium]